MKTIILKPIETRESIEHDRDKLQVENTLLTADVAQLKADVARLTAEVARLQPIVNAAPVANRESSRTTDGKYYMSNGKYDTIEKEAE